LASDASVVVRGDLDFESVSSTLFEVVGASASRGYAVFDTAHLGGSLEVIVTSDTAPSLGDRWSLVRATEITSEFGSVSLAALADPELRLFLRLTEGTLTDSLELLVRHIADPNGDMMVNMDDLNLVLHDYGQTGALLAGDADTNGIVDFRDLNLVLANFGQTFRAVAVPTPGGIALALLGVGLAGRRQR
jgi:hypothetical protein